MTPETLLTVVMIAFSAALVFILIFIPRKIRQGTKILERRIGEQEEFISAILQNSAEAIVFFDIDNRIQVWNRGAERIFGYKAEEMLNQTFHRLVPSDQDPEEELEQINEAVFEHGYIENYIAPRLTRDKRRIIVSFSRTVVRDKEGRIVGSTAFIRDVTEQMELDQRIYHTEKLASIGMLAAGVAHEINNPLSIILGFTDLLLEDKDPSHPDYKDLKTIEENADQARRIVTQLLGFARVSEGRQDTANVREVVMTVLKIIEHTLTKRNIKLELDLPDNLPEVRGDPREFQQVVLNLVNNALGAMEDSGGKLVLKAEHNEKCVMLLISDNGTGIPKSIRQRIFDPFFTTKEIGMGTGLGLSLSYGIVKKYGGRISFTSDSREDNPDAESGTTFTITLPLKQPSAQDEVEAKGEEA